MKKCPNCGAQMSDDSLFCTECGKPIPQENVCPHCGAQVNENDAFCQHCGKSLSEPPVGEADYAAETEESASKMIWFYVAGAVVLLAILGGGYYAWKGNQHTENQDVAAADSTMVESVEGSADSPWERLAVAVAKYDQTESFHEGLAGVVKEGKVGVIDMDGNEVVPTVYDNVTRTNSAVGGNWKVCYVNGFSIIEKGGQTGFIDKSGKELVIGEYEVVQDFSEGLAPVQKNDLWGYIDTTGKLVIPCQYQTAEAFEEGMARVRNSENQTYGYINKSGEVVIPFSEHLGPFHDGLAPFYSDGQYGYIDRKGKQFIPNKFHGTTMFSDGLAVVIDEDGKFGYIDKKGNLVIPYQYEFSGDGAYAHKFVDGLAVVYKDGKYAYIDKKGNEGPWVYSILECRDGMARVFRDVDSGEEITNGKGKVIVPPGKYKYTALVGNGLIRVRDNAGKLGLLNSEGQTVVPCGYDDLGDGYTELIAAKKDGRWGYIDLKGNSTFDISNDKIQAAKEAGDALKAKCIGYWSYYIQSEGQRVRVYTAVVNSDMSAKYVIFTPDGDINTEMDYRYCTFNNGYLYFTNYGNIDEKGAPRFKIGPNGLQHVDGQDLVKESKEALNPRPKATNSSVVSAGNRPTASSGPSRSFTSEQSVTMYLANQTFRSNDGFTIRFDGNMRMYANGDYAGVVSVLRYHSDAALLRYGGGQYTEGRFSVQIVGNKLQLTDPVDGTVYYQK